MSNMHFRSLTLLLILSACHQSTDPGKSTVKANPTHDLPDKASSTSSALALTSTQGMNDSIANLPAATLPTDTPKKVTTQSPEPAKAKALDTTILGIDVSVNLVDFQKLYKDKIEKCKSGKFINKEIGSKFSLDTVTCKLKNGMGTADFYEGKMYKYKVKIATKKLRLPQSVQFYRELAGTGADEYLLIGLYIGVDILADVICAGEVTFASGKISIKSSSQMQALADSGINPGTRCPATIYEQAMAENLEYTAKTLAEMNAQLVGWKDDLDRKGAAEALAH